MNSAKNDSSEIENTDDRNQFEYASRYPLNIQIEIWIEAAVLLLLCLVSILILFLVWKGYIGSVLELSPHEAKVIKKYAYYSSSGVLGGLIFGMKYFYRVVARGWWSQDRRFWRILSPFISGIIALMTGILIDASFLNNTSPHLSGPYIVSIGFLAGYFADEAVGKMYEVASVVFGTIKKG